MVALVAAAGFANPGPVEAAVTWTAGTNSQWSNDANWSGLEPTYSDEVIFPTGYPGGFATIDLSSGEQFAHLRFYDDYTLSNGDLTTGAGAAQITADAGRTVTISSSFVARTDAGPTDHLYFNGLGTVILAGDNSAFPKHADLAGGTLSLRHSNAVPGAYVHVNGPNRTLELHGGLTYGNRIIYLSGGNPGTGVIRSTGGDNVWTGTIYLHSHDGTREVYVEDGTSLTFNNGFTGGSSDYTVEKIGDGTLKLLGGNGGLTWDTVVSAGTLELHHDNALGNSSGSTTVAAGATLELHDTGGNRTFSPTQLTLNGGAATLKNVSGENTWNGPVSASHESQITVESGSTLTMPGSFSGASKLAKDGGGILILAGDLSAHTGWLDVDAGIVRLTADQALPTQYANVRYTGQLEFSGGITIPNDREILLASGDGVLRNLDGDNVMQGGLALHASSGTRTVEVAADTLEVTGRVRRYYDTSDMVLEKTGPGTLILSGDSVTGDGYDVWDTHIAAGAVNVRHDGALGAAGNQVTLDAGTALQLQGGITVDGVGITLPAGDGLGNGSLHSVSGDNTWTGPMTSNVSSYIGASPGATLTITSDITGSDRILVTGGGTTIFSGDNSGKGGWADVGNGILRLTSDNAVPGSYIHVTGGIGKTLELAGDITVTGKIAYLSANPGSSDIPALHNVDGDNTWSGPINLHGNDGPRQISVDGGTSLTASQGIYAGYTNELIKRGTGLLTLAAPSSGDFVTRVEEGTLALVGNAHLNTNATIFVGEGATLDVSGVTAGPYALANAQTLHGNGTVFGDLDVAAGSTISGGASPGHLTVDGNLVIGDDAQPAEGGILLAELGGAIQGDPAGYDWIEVTGAATFAAGATIDVDLFGGFTPSVGNVFDILTAQDGITNADLSAVAIDFGGAAMAAGQWTAEIVSLGGAAEAVRLSAVPEPGSCLLAVAGALGLVFIRRRRGARR